jgi:hypothetical protein
MKKAFYFFIAYSFCLFSINIYSQNNVSTFSSSESNNISLSEGAKRYIVIVGVSEFKDKAIVVQKREYVENDTKAFADFFKSPKGGNVPEENIKLLLNKDATKLNIDKAVDWGLSKAKNDDLLIFYFTGSGLRDSSIRGNINFLVYDSDFNQVNETSYSLFNLVELFKKYDNLKNILFILDINPNPLLIYIAYSKSELMNIISDKKYKPADTNFILFSSSEPVETPIDDSTLKRSIFNHYLIEGLEGVADENKDNLITLREIIDFTMFKVSRNSNHKQHPCYYSKLNLNHISISFLNSGKK